MKERKVLDLANIKFLTGKLASALTEQNDDGTLKIAIEPGNVYFTEDGKIYFDTVNSERKLMGSSSAHAVTADGFTSNKTITLVGDVSGAAAGGANAGWTIPTTVADDSHDHTNFLVLDGSRTMTGSLKLKASANSEGLATGALDLQNSNINHVHTIYFDAHSTPNAPGLYFYRDTTHVDSLYAKDGVLYFAPNKELNNSSYTSHIVLTSNNYNSYAPTKTGTGATGTWPISISGKATSADSASKIATDAGSSTKPVYFSGGVPVACGDTLAISITGNAASATTATTADTAAALTAARTIKFTGDVNDVSVAFDGTKDISFNLAIKDNSHNHTYLTSRGAVAAETEANIPAVAGLSMTQVYNNGYPTNYGNVMTMRGSGCGQLLIGWSGTSGANAPIYVRSKHDTSSAEWSSWAELITSVNIGSQNAGSATKLAASHTINGTAFNGTADITTTKWGTARNITIKDASQTNGGAAVSVDGSGAATLLLPSTIKAALTGNASTASKLATAVAINGTNFDGSAAITTSKWGTARTVTIGSNAKSVDGSANVSWTLKEILGNNLISSNNLPSYVDDVLEVDNYASLPATGEGDKIYVTTDNNYSYRWGGSTYIWIGNPLGLGTTDDTAYTGSSGKALEATVNTHITNKSNPHSVTASQVGAVAKTGDTMSGRLTANGKISVPNTGTSWVGGMTLSNAAINITTQNTAGSYHPIIGVKTYSNHVVNLGGYIDEVGFYGYRSGRTANATDWAFTFNASTGNISHTSKITASGGFVGNLTGNASGSASSLATARTLTIGNTGKSFNGTSNVSWSLDEIGAAPRKSWTAVVTGQTWSRLCYVACGGGVVGSSYILNIGGTRNNVVYNDTYVIKTHHSSRAHISKISGTNYTTGVQIRVLANSGGDSYVEFYDNGNSIATTSTQSVYCRLIPIYTGAITTYTAFTDGTTLPTNFSVGQTLTTTAKDFQGSLAWDDVADKPSSFTPSAHNHDERYFTEAEVNSKLTGYLPLTGGTLTGDLTVKGKVTVGAGVSLIYDATNQCLNFVF